MSDDISTSYTPLYDPETDGITCALPVDMALDGAREVLAEQATANIHDDRAMLLAAVKLEIRLRQLVAALDKGAGR